MTALTSNMFASSFGLKSATSVIGLAGQMAAAQAQNSAAEATALSAVQSYENQMSMERLRLNQEAKASAKEAENLMIERRQKVGEVMASSMGAGQSLDALIYDYNRQEARYRNTLDMNMQWRRDQANENAKGYYSQAKARVESARASASNFGLLDVAGFGINVLGGALDSYREFVLPNK